MTFLDSQVCIPLYDVKKGGAPRGFQCKIENVEKHSPFFIYQCNKVTRTYRGMKMHLWLVHKFVAQQKLFPEAKPNE